MPSLKRELGNGLEHLLFFMVQQMELLFHFKLSRIKIIPSGMPICIVGYPIKKEQISILFTRMARQKSPIKKCNF